jgi:DNA-directed RNA polymerase specialized sigma24 family protein
VSKELKKGKNYVDNTKLYEAYLEWYTQRKEAKEKGLKEPEPPIYISECILLIPKRLASKNNFSGYSFKEDMIGDAVENIIRYFRNFNPEKSKNPFAYFTQIAYHAFLRRIIMEKKYTKNKIQMLLESDAAELFSTQEHDLYSDFGAPSLEAFKVGVGDLVADKPPPKKRQLKLKKSSLENLLDHQESKEEESYGAA